MEVRSDSPTGTQATVVRRSRQASFRERLGCLRCRFPQDGDLPPTDVLTEEPIAPAPSSVTGWLDRIFSPPVAPRVFPAQVLSADRPCRAAVARSIARRLARGLAPRSARTGAYRQARKRLPESFFADVACSVGRALDSKAQRSWLWQGRRVCPFDGTAVTVPDTPEDRAAYPQVSNRGPGLGFPLARIGAIALLARGAVVSLGVCRYAGRGEGEVGLLRRPWDVLAPGDVLPADRPTANWASIQMLQERGVELVGRPDRAHREADFRRGRRPGAGDRVVRWPKPTSIRSLDREAYRALPESIAVREARVREARVREARVRVTQPGFRTRSVVVVTTPPDPRQATEEDLAELYRARWNAELDLRSIKSAMQMRELRCKTPEPVREEEVWAHVPAYNPLRAVMAQAAARHDVVPRSIGFTGAMRTPEAFRPLLELGVARGAAGRSGLYHELLDAIATHRVADRPDRYEPRVKKRRRNHYGWPTRPRAEFKRRMAKGGAKN